jgi:hypothetical protein
MTEQVLTQKGDDPVSDGDIARAVEDFLAGCRKVSKGCCFGARLHTLPFQRRIDSQPLSTIFSGTAARSTSLWRWARMSHDASGDGEHVRDIPFERFFMHSWRSGLSTSGRCPPRL